MPSSAGLKEVTDTKRRYLYIGYRLSLLHQRQCCKKKKSQGRNFLQDKSNGRRTKTLNYYISFRNLAGTKQWRI